MNVTEDESSSDAAQDQESFPEAVMIKIESSAQENFSTTNVYNGEIWLPPPQAGTQARSARTWGATILLTALISWVARKA